MKHLRYLILTLLAAVAILPAAGKSITLSVSDPHPGVGDYFYVYITVNDIGDRLSGAPGAPGAKQLYFQLKGMQQQTTVINGRSTMSSKATYAVTLRAEKEGKFTYGPVTLGGVRSNTVSYTIGKARPGGKPAPAGQNIGAAPSAPKLVHAGGKDLFLKAVVSETSPYEHQPIVYTIRAYTSYQGTQVNGAPGAPQFENCTYEQTKYDLAVKTLAAVRPSAPHLRVNAVAPGDILPPESIHVAAKPLLLQRRPTPRDVADAVLYLIQAPAVTGQLIAVDGGSRFLEPAN